MDRDQSHAAGPPARRLAEEVKLAIPGCHCWLAQLQGATAGLPSSARETAVKALPGKPAVAPHSKNVQC